MDYWLNAEDIRNDALRLNADRICFVSAGDRWYVEPSNDELADTINFFRRRGERVKYKLQTYDGSNFEDVQNYRELFDFRAVLGGLRATDFIEPLRVSPWNVAQAARQYPEGFRRSLGRVVANVRWGELLHNPNARTLSLAAEFLSQVRVKYQDAHLDYTYSFLVLLQLAYDSGLRGQLQDPSRGTAAQGSREAVKAVGEHRMPSVYFPAAVEVARLNLLGQLASFYDRELAACYFRRMKDADSGSWVRDLYSDMGAMTYFERADIMRDSVKERAEEVKRSICELQWTDPSAKMAVAMSADPAFFRIYGHQMLHAAQQLPHFDFVFVLCASAPEAKSLMRDSQGYLGALARLNNSSYPENINFLRVSVPDWVANPKAFYASARFFAVEKLLIEYEAVYVMDMDLEFTEDPSTYFRRVSKMDFAVPFSQGHNTLSPWRRYMAGNVLFGQGSRTSTTLIDLESYLARGLVEPDSWMLDQNALAYAVEMGPHRARLPPGQPTNQFSFRTLWEARYREAS